MTRQDKTRQDKTRQDKHCHSRQYLSIPCCVKKDDKDGNFVKVENATRNKQHVNNSTEGQFSYGESFN